MKRAFIYALWKDSNDPTRWEKKILGRNLPQAARHRETLSPSVVYCWGHENQGQAQRHGFETVLVEDNPSVWGTQGESMWRHKMEAWRLALQEHDEIVFLDIDVYPKQEVPEDFGTDLEKRDDLFKPAFINTHVYGPSGVNLMDCTFMSKD